MTMGLSRHIRSVSVMGLVAAAGLAACTPASIRDSWIDRAAGATRVDISEGAFDVAFVPLASPPGRRADAWVLGTRVDAPFTIVDGGVPALRVNHADGHPMTEAEHEKAVAAASASCVDRPGWTPAKAALIARPVAGTDATKYYGAGYLIDGAWTLMGVCK